MGDWMDKTIYVLDSIESYWLGRITTIIYLVKFEKEK
jgi:hypothetical protein